MKIKKKEGILAWHFIKSLGQPPLMAHLINKNVVIVPGKTYSVPGRPKMCARGLHASVTIYNAWSHVRGDYLCRVRLFGEVIDSRNSSDGPTRSGYQKFVANHRKVLWMVRIPNRLIDTIYGNDKTIIRNVKKLRRLTRTELEKQFKKWNGETP